MAEPLIEIFAPERRGANWASAARIHFPEGVVDVVAKAPQAVVAKQLARVQALLAYRRSPEMPEPDKPIEWIEPIKPRSPFRQRVRAGVGASGPPPGLSEEDQALWWEVYHRTRTEISERPETTFWDDVAGVVSDILDSDAAQNIVNGLVSLIPVAGAAIVGSGIVGPGMEAASAAIDEAQKQGTAGELAAAARAAEEEARRAQEQAQAQGDRTKAQNASMLRRRLLGQRRAMRGMVQAKQQQGDEQGAETYTGMIRAHETVKQAEQGDPEAQERIVYIIERAAEGDPNAEEATAYLAVMMEFILAMLESDYAAEYGYGDEYADAYGYGEVGALGPEDSALFAKLSALLGWKRHMRRLVREGKRPRQMFSASEEALKTGALDKAAAEAAERVRQMMGRTLRRAGRARA